MIIYVECLVIFACAQFYLIKLEPFFPLQCLPLDFLKLAIKRAKKKGIRDSVKVRIATGQGMVRENKISSKSERSHEPVFWVKENWQFEEKSGKIEVLKALIYSYQRLNIHEKGVKKAIYEKNIHPDEGLMLKTSAFNLFMVANLPYQLSW